MVRRLAALVLSILVLTVVLTSLGESAGAVTVVPARSATDPNIPGPSLGYWSGIKNLFDYKLSVTSEQLYDSMPETAKAAWGTQEARMAAASAGRYRASLIYNNVGAQELASVTPINGYKDRLTPGFSASAFRKVLGSPVTAAVAVTAFAMRGDIANTSLSWFGMDANANVCSDPVFGGNNPLNWLTGQDCSMWHTPGSFVPNSGTVAGLTGTACDPGAPANCATIVQDGSYTSGPSYTTNVACFTTTGSVGGIYWSTGSSAAGGYTSQGFIPGNMDSPANLHWYAPGPCPSDLAIDENTGGGPIGWFAIQSATGVPGGVVPVMGDGNPDRVVTCLMTMTDGSTTTGTTDPKTETQIATDGWPQPVCRPIPDGKTLAHIHITEDSPGESNVLQDEDTIATYQAGAGSANAACDTKACILDLVDVRTGVSCFNEAATCDGWFADPTYDADYQCTYGGSDEPKQSCYAYANTFNAAKRQAGDAYADPHTGDDPGTGSSPNEDQLNLARPLQDPTTTTRNCFGGTYSAFNPLEWVVKPIQCGMEWAFAPRQAVVNAATTGLAAAWGATIFGQVQPLVSQFSAVPTGTGCSGIPVNIDETWPTVWSWHFNLGAACSDPMHTGALVMSGLLGTLILAGAVLLAANYIAHAMGYRGFGRGGGAAE
jgi:hypothetical protein